MRRIAASVVLSVLALTAFGSAGCEGLDGRNRIRKGNRLFKDSCFVQSSAQYQKALTEVDDPIVHYNLGLSLQKLLRPGADKAIPLDIKDSLACEMMGAQKGVSTQDMKVCVKIKEEEAGEKCADARFTPCDEKNVCPSSARCETVNVCQILPGDLADMITGQFKIWLTAHPDDTETRAIMTQVWLDISEFDKATEYWGGLLKEKPNDPEIMGSLAGIALKAGDWRASIEWYLKVAEATKDDAAKINAYQFVGNVGWAKLNSKTLTQDESIELADRAIAALQKAAALSPANPKFVGLQASIFNFRSMTQGASFAAAIDRASAADLQHKSRVLSDEAKKAQGLPVTPAPTNGSGSAAPAQGSGSAAPAPANGSGSATPTNGSGSAAPAPASGSGSAATKAPATGSAAPAKKTGG